MYVGDDSVTETMNDILRAAFTEDKPILEATQRQEENAQAVSTVQLAIDRGPLAYRARISQMVELETDQQSGVIPNSESSSQMGQPFRSWTA